jgi:hypothetical protein
VVTGDDDLMPMRQRANPFASVRYRLQIAAIRKIAAMNEDIAIRDFQAGMLLVGVGCDYDAHYATIALINVTSNTPEHRSGGLFIRCA